MRLVGRVHDWLQNFMPASPEGLAARRILFAGYFLLIGIPNFAWVADSPPAFFYPPPLSIGSPLMQFPPQPFLRALDLGIVTCLVLVLVGCFTKTASRLLTVLWIVGNTFRFSFGKIDHNILAVLFPFVLSFSNWGAALSMDARRAQAARDAHADPKRSKIESWPLAFMAFLLAFGFLTAGLPKMLRWADFDLTTQGGRGWLVEGFYTMGRAKYLAPLFLKADVPLFWEMFDLGAIVFECGFILAVWKRTSFLTWVFIATCFHLMAMLVLNISFGSLMPVYACFLPWEKMVTSRPLAGIMRRIERLITGRNLFIALAAFAPLCFIADLLTIDGRVSGVSHIGAVWNLLTGTSFYDGIVDLLVTLGAMVAFAAACWPSASRMDAAAPASLVVFRQGSGGRVRRAIRLLGSFDEGNRLKLAESTAPEAQALVQAGTARSALLVSRSGLLYTDVEAFLVAAWGTRSFRGRLVASGLLLPRLIRRPILARILELND